jgi:hypothetical protein
MAYLLHGTSARHCQRREGQCYMRYIIRTFACSASILCAPHSGAAPNLLNVVGPFHRRCPHWPPGLQVLNRGAAYGAGADVGRAPPTAHSVAARPKLHAHLRRTADDQRTADSDGQRQWSASMVHGSWGGRTKMSRQTTHSPSSRASSWNGGRGTGLERSLG